MTDRYRWTDEGMHQLLCQTGDVYDALLEVGERTRTLMTAINSDSSWIGEHKSAFMAWMDLLTQYVTKLSASDVAPAAMLGLSAFEQQVPTFSIDSPACRSLGSVGVG